MKPGADVLVDLVLQHAPPNARVLDLGGAPVPPPRLASRRIIVAREDEALTMLRDQSAAFDAIVSAWPSRFAPLIPLLHAIRTALKEDGRAILVDLVWQTAPSPELMRAFAPAAGHEKVRPIEGYEMQIEHCGFDVVEKSEVPRDRWTHALAPEQRAAVEADTRGAARLMAWILAPGSDE